MVFKPEFCSFGYYFSKSKTGLDSQDVRETALLLFKEMCIEHQWYEILGDTVKLGSLIAEIRDESFRELEVTKYE